MTGRYFSINPCCYMFAEQKEMSECHDDMVRSVWEIAFSLKYGLLTLNDSRFAFHDMPYSVCFW